MYSTLSNIVIGSGGGGGGRKAMLRTGMVGGAAISGVIQKLSVGRLAVFDHVIRGACDRVYVYAAPEDTRNRRQVAWL